MKKIALLLMVAALAMASLTACSKKEDPVTPPVTPPTTPPVTAPVAPAAPKVETFEAKEMAYGEGKEVTVKVTYTDGVITAVTADTSNQTENVGQPVGEKLAANILEKKGTAGVEIVAGATVTSNAVIKAADAAIAQKK